MNARLSDNLASWSYYYTTSHLTISVSLMLTGNRKLVPWMGDNGTEVFGVKFWLPSLRWRREEGSMLRKVFVL